MACTSTEDETSWVNLEENQKFDLCGRLRLASGVSPGLAVVSTMQLADGKHAQLFSL